MNSIVLFFSFCLVVSLSVQGQAASVFQTCANKFYDNVKDKEILCKITNLEIDANMKDMVNFMTCGLKNLGYYDEVKKDMNADKILKDMEQFGYKKEKEVKEVIEECKTEFGADITSLDYLSCLLIDQKTWREFKMLIMITEADFMKQNFCS